MEVKVKQAAFFIRKYALFSLEYTYRFTCGHPFVSSFVFSLFLLHSCYPILFAFLASTFPVLFCTAFLLGILLLYGDPNVPEIEEDRLNWKASYLEVENPLDGFFVENDRSYTLDGLADSRVGTKGRFFNVLTTEGKKNKRGGPLFAASSSVLKQNQTGENHILVHGVLEKVGVLMNGQSECDERMNEVTDGVTKGVEGLTVTTNKPVYDQWLDPFLGSPRKPINIHDFASDSESDQAESSSPDASMTDILPMLNELHPLLDSKQPTSASDSDTELFQHHESDENSVEQEVEHKLEESDASNMAVTWTADDQKNVMDLGSSDLERNRRLESLIARRRARKNQIIIFEKDLIDLHSNDMAVDKLFRFHPQIPPICAPRRNPFDLHHEPEESMDYLPIPGSAPSALLRRQNPFDFSCDREDDSQGLTGDNLCHREFGVPFHRGLSFRRHESFASRSFFPSNFLLEKHGSTSSSRLKPHCDNEKLGLEHNEYVVSDTISSAIDPEHQMELAEQEMHKNRDLSVSDHDIKSTLHVSQSCRDDLIDFESELTEDGDFLDPNVCAVNEETHQIIDASAIFKPEIEGTMIASNMLEGQKHELVEEKHGEWTLFFSSEGNEKRLDTSPHGTLEAQGQITSFTQGTSKSVQSSDTYASSLLFETDKVYHRQAEFPIYDFSPGSGNFMDNIFVPDDALLSSGRKDSNSASSEYCHVREGASEENMTSEVEFELFHGSKLKDSTSDGGEPVTFSAYINILDDDILSTKGVSATGEYDFIENRSAGLPEDFGDLANTIEVDHFGFSSKKSGMNETDFMFLGDLPPTYVEEKHQPLEKLEIQTSFGTLLEGRLNDGISNSQSSDIKLLQTNQNINLRNLNDYNADPGDLEAEVREMQFIDECLLSELDAVGDFQVGVKPQQWLYVASQSARLLDCFIIEDSELKSANTGDTSPNKSMASPDSNEVDFDLNQRKMKKSGFWAMDPVDDLELTVYKPKLHVLQAYSHEGLSSAFKQDLPGEIAVPPLSESITENFVAENSHVGLSRFDMSHQDKVAVPHATLLTSSEKNGDCSSSDLREDGTDFGNLLPVPTFFQLNDNYSSMDGFKSVVTVVDACVSDPSLSGLSSHTSLMNEAVIPLIELDISNRDLVKRETNSELFVVEANTIEDIDSAFNHACETIFNDSLAPLVTSERKLINTVDIDVREMSHEVSSRTPDVEEMELCSPSTESLSDLIVVEAKFVKGRQLAFKQATEGVSAMTTSLVDSSLNRVDQELGFAESLFREIKSNSELLIPNGKLSEDIDSAFKKPDIGKMVAHSNVKVKDDETGHVNEENDTKFSFLEKNCYNFTSTSQESKGQVFHKPFLHQVHTMALGSSVNAEVVDVSLEAQIEPQLLLSAKSSESNTINLVLEQGIEEFLVYQAGYFQTGDGYVRKNPVWAEDNPGNPAMETLLFEDTNLDSKKAAADSCSQPTTILINPECDPLEQVLVEKPTDLGSSSDLNLGFKKDYLPMSIRKEDIGYDTVEESFLTYDNNSDLLVEEKSNVNVQSSFLDASAKVHEGSFPLSTDHMPVETHPGRKVEDIKCSMAENCSEMFVIKAKSFDDINSPFKLATSMPFSPVLTDVGSHDIKCTSSSLVFDSVLKQNCNIGSSKLMFSVDPPTLLVNQDNEFMEENPAGKNNSEMLVDEEKSAKDIKPTSKQVTEGFLVKPITLQNDSKTERDLELLIPVSNSVSDSYKFIKQDMEENSFSVGRLNERSFEKKIIAAEKEEIVEDQGSHLREHT